MPSLGTLLRPRVAFSLWAANLAIWHVPYIYDLALAHENLHDFEHLCWMFCGVLVWTLLVDPGSHRRLTVGGRVALAASMFAAGQILTDVLVFSFTPLYPWYHGAYGISALTDQQLAGIVMMVEQLATLGTCVALLLLPRWSRGRAGLALARNVSPTAFSWEPLFLALAVAAGALYLRAARTEPPARWRARRLRLRALPDRGLAQLAARDDRGQVPPAHPPAAERAHRRRRAAARPARPDAADARATRPPRAGPAAPALDPPDLARRLVPAPTSRSFYNWALRTGWGLNIEHAILIAAGLLFWWPIVSGTPHAAGGLAYLAVAFLGSSFLGLAYIFSSRPFYSFYEHAPRLWGLSPISDQNLGGILMNGEQTLVFLLAIGWFVMRLLDEEHARGRRFRIHSGGRC